MVALLLFTATAYAQEEAPPQGAPALEQFSVVWERNLFDPNRQPPAADMAYTATPAAPPVPDRLQLTGVLLVGEEQTAFFEGTRAGFNALAKAGDTVGGFLVERVRIDGVDLAMGEQRLSIEVGGAATGGEPGTWTIAAQEAGPWVGVQVQPPVATESVVSETPAVVPAEAGDIMERLKARRQQELGK
jgi:hypothetical protein